MKLQFCCIKDHALACFTRPFHAQTTAQAIRIFHDLIVNNQDLAAHASDYDLVHLGSWDDNNGRSENEDSPVLLARGKDVQLQRA